MAEASNENVNLLLTKIMTDRFCKTESHNLDACVDNYVPQKIDGSYIDQSLQRRGLAKCAPYKDDAMKCLQDEKRQTAVIKAASRVPSCKEERAAVAKCQRAHPGNNAACEGETLENRPRIALLEGQLHALDDSQRVVNPLAPALMGLPEAEVFSIHKNPKEQGGFMLESMNRLNQERRTPDSQQV